MESATGTKLTEGFASKFEGVVAVNIQAAAGCGRRACPAQEETQEGHGGVDRRGQLSGAKVCL